MLMSFTWRSPVGREPRFEMKRSSLLVALVAVAALLIVIQFVPAGARTNPPVIREPAWDAPVTREIAVVACFDCHSNETVWPWYSRVAPISWLVIRDTNEGRQELNFSEWGTGREQADGEDASESVLDRSMPMRIYLVTHGDARLDDGQHEMLAAGLLRTLGPGESDEAGEDDD